ncbi:uncharacterized transmembrane protein DDB_G0289901-like isoform X2 [Neocloeon triangulifer]|uniref:uncharacterized transmembrane protein DDB_G0289901-like isoform X2 n=1 Tax=Neocloeon triangulifer TaxID=2078957 RepID=UPI00286F0E85|nr:uncharacterized transmembrane protein DDB_G0289901-like isoform X2 [Neocloeon triangulifer]
MTLVWKFILLISIFYLALEVSTEKSRNELKPRSGSGGNGNILIQRGNGAGRVQNIKVNAVSGNRVHITINRRRGNHTNNGNRLILLKCCGGSTTCDGSGGSDASYDGDYPDSNSGKAAGSENNAGAGKSSSAAPSDSGAGADPGAAAADAGAAGTDSSGGSGTTGDATTDSSQTVDAAAGSGGAAADAGTGGAAGAASGGAADTAGNAAGGGSGTGGAAGGGGGGGAVVETTTAAPLQDTTTQPVDTTTTTSTTTVATTTATTVANGGGGGGVGGGWGGPAAGATETTTTTTTTKLTTTTTEVPVVCPNQTCPPVNGSDACAYNPMVVTMARNGMLPPGTGSFQTTCGKEYVFAQQLGTYAEAVKACCTLSTRLASMEKVTEIKCLASFVKSSPTVVGSTTKFWVSGLNYGCRGNYKWCSTNTAFDTNEKLWLPGQPSRTANSTCVFVTLDPAGFGLSNENCDQKMGFICE